LTAHEEEIQQSEVRERRVLVTAIDIVAAEGWPPWIASASLDIEVWLGFAPRVDKMVIDTIADFTR
jgi:hypothetical protein